MEYTAQWDSKPSDQLHQPNKQSQGHVLQSKEVSRRYQSLHCCTPEWFLAGATFRFASRYVMWPLTHNNSHLCPVGSVLYLPAGYWHRVVCDSDEGSLSINFSISTRSWLDLLGDTLMQQLWKDPQWRENIIVDSPEQVTSSLSSYRVVVLMGVLSFKGKSTSRRTTRKTPFTNQSADSSGTTSWWYFPRKQKEEYSPRWMGNGGLWWWGFGRVHWRWRW